MEAGRRRRGLDDASFAEEIELYGELVVAASEVDGELAQDAIDRALGLVPGSGSTGPVPTRG